MDFEKFCAALLWVCSKYAAVCCCTCIVAQMTLSKHVSRVKLPSNAKFNAILTKKRGFMHYAANMELCCNFAATCSNMGIFGLNLIIHAFYVSGGRWA